MTKNKIVVALAVVLVALVGYGVAKLTIKQNVTYNTTTTQSAPVGATFSTAKIAAIAVSTATVTPATLYNGDSNDRIITGVFQMNNTPTTQNGTTTQYYIVAATSTNPYNLLSAGGAANTNYVFAGPGTGGTTGSQLSQVGNYLMSSSTLNSKVGSQDAVGLLRWPSGTYLNFTIASSTNLTAAKNYVFTNATGATLNNNGRLGSTTTGVWGVTYIPQ